MANERIILNVGGHKYETYRSTLTAYPNTFLGTMFAERNQTLLHPSANNEYFFDRNGRAFHFILEYYRTGSILWSPSSLITQAELEKELDFWQISTSSSSLFPSSSFSHTLKDSAKLVQDFLEMLRILIKVPHRYLRTKVNLVFPLFNSELFSVEPGFEDFIKLVEPFKHIGYPISRECGKVLAQNLMNEIKGLRCEISAEGSNPNDWRYRWEFIIPLPYSFDQILSNVNFKPSS
ncbi:1967_t:CDS:2 [Ambispora leptoticha]|uniref:1967_t:CDS:1 n=1 Tax=Ambispora leptoticha TaxID=144679 RepID=A0A9N8VEK8_9GLOM|nr:1967_t:CDS:2 [Ambispora leptoticha]